MNGNNHGRFPARGKYVRIPGPVEDGKNVLLSWRGGCGRRG